MSARSIGHRYGGFGVDTELIGRAQHGDEEAFASLAVAAGDRLHAVAHRILRDIDLAEDATQQALLAIWRDLPQLRDPARFREFRVDAELRTLVWPNGADLAPEGLYERAAASR